ncbi:MAG: relaxase/mobilization nuclease domain-containing protein [Oscillospiraceae bacterium]|nr:relaxase/mobilization nuclease domain-containing protein [Oscillospiraceae bacterium]
MAILKHGTSKNADYGDALTYLLFEHDGRTMKPVLDENGNMVRRRDYILDGINCNPFTYAEECRELNEQFHKNQKPDEIKAHHYIISFDPLDQSECGLTGEKAQELGLEFARKNFPGHQTLVCTHLDGHNGSGNIHVHIVINSLRKFDVEPQESAERLCDCKAGFKHHQTRSLLTHMQKSLMEICEREGLHQVDLLSPSENKISEREYWAIRRRKAKLGKQSETNESNAEFDYSIFGESPPDYVEVFFLKTDLRLVIDLQDNVKAQQSRAYAQKVKLTNLKQMANTIVYVQQNGYDTREALQNSYDEILAKRIEAKKELRETEDKLKDINEVIRYMGQYLSNKKVFGEMLNSKNKKKFREAHSAEITVYENAVRFLKNHYLGGKIPSMKALQQEKTSLMIRRDAKQNTYNYLYDYTQELKTVCSNVDAILKPQEEKEVKKTRQEEILC